MLTSYVFSAYQSMPELDGLVPGASLKLAALPETTLGLFDQDARLSGRGPRGEVRDRDGQTGAPGADDAYFITARYLLSDGSGGRFRLIEIAEEGSEETFFTFFRGGPAPEADLSVLAVRGGPGPGLRYDLLGLTEPAQTSSLSGRYFCDDDDDAAFGPGDPALAGMAVTLLDAEGTRIASTETAEDGSFQFTGLDEGRYRVLFQSAPPTKEFVAPDRGENDQSGSDVIDGQGMTDWISVIEGQDVTGVNAGIAYVDSLDTFLF